MGTSLSPLLLIVLDGVPWRNWQPFFGNLEGWVASGDAQRFRMKSVLPSISACCYASIHTGLSPQEHGCTGNGFVSRLEHPDIFSAVRKAGGTTAAVTHSFWSEFFYQSPFNPIEDIEYDLPDSPSINHGRFHTMGGYNLTNPMTPSDTDLFATLSMLCTRFSVDYGILHTCTLDSMGHRFGHDCTEMDHACLTMDVMLSAYIPRWWQMGYQIIVTADHGQSARGHHGGHGEDQQDFALYYFGEGKAASSNAAVLDQRQLAPTVLDLMGVPIPASMRFAPFLQYGKSQA